MNNRFSGWVGFALRPMLFFLILEFGLSFVPIPDWWEAGVLHDYLYKNRIQNWYNHATVGEYNSKGYRDSEWGLGGKKVALLGDSRTFGLHVDVRQTYARLIESQSRWESMNLGVPGATTFEALDSMLPDLLPYEPEAAVVCLDINSSLYSYIGRDHRSRKGNVLRHFVRSFSSWRVGEGFWHALFSKRKPVLPLDEYKEQLALLFQTLSKNNVKKNILLVGWTPLKNFPELYTRERYDAYREASRVIARKLGIPVVEYTQELRGMANDEAYIGEHQIHLSPQGHQKIASALIRKLHE